MRVQTFIGKMSIEGLRQMDDHINTWLEDHEIEPKQITQCFGMGQHRETTSSEPIVVTSIWY